MATTAVRSCFRAGLDRSGSRGHRPGMATEQQPGCYGFEKSEKIGEWRRYPCARVLAR